MDNLLIGLSLLLALLVGGAVIAFLLWDRQSQKLTRALKESMTQSFQQREEALLKELDKLKLEQATQMALEQERESKWTEEREQLEIEKRAFLDEREAWSKKRAQEVFAFEEREQGLVVQLEELAQLSKEEAQKQLLEAWRPQLNQSLAHEIQAYHSHLNEQKELISKRVLSQAIQRQSSDFISKETVVTVSLPHEKFKGRIIGKEGQNIRAFERLSEVELLIDETPGVVVLSCFDPVRREVARRALEALIEDGRIHPDRIESAVLDAKEQLDMELPQIGQAAASELELYDFHPEVLSLLGRLAFRTSYGQNILNHSKEVARAAGIMAAELGGDVSVAKRAGFLHDLGKAITHKEQGTHTALGVDAAAQYGESPEVLHAMAAHHFDVNPQTLEAILVQVADTLSAARPGARSEAVDLYIKRVKELENLVRGFEGIEKAYVVQAGREVRAIVDPDLLSDDEMIVLSETVRKTIEKELNYPGQIKVSMIREFSNTVFAR